jgi:spermidine synthase
MRLSLAIRRFGAVTVIALILLPSLLGCQRHRIVHQVRSPYQLVTVVDTPHGFRRLIFDGRLDGSDPIQSEMNLSKPHDLSLSYTRAMMAALSLADHRERILLIGLGGASMQKFLHDLLPVTVLETIEIDPEVVRIARKFFGLEPADNQIIHVDDGRAFIENSNKRYDIIFLDAYGPDSIPYSLATQEFLETVRERLAEGGVVCANLLTENPHFWDMVKTYAEVFPELRLIKPPRSKNTILFAPLDRPGLTAEVWAREAAAFEKEYPTDLNLPSLIRSHTEDRMRIPDRAKVLRDKTTAPAAGPLLKIPLIISFF